jgi:hypothetical protein
MMGGGPTHSCRNLFKRLEILPIPCVYLLSLMTFVVNNYDKFFTNKSIHAFGTRSNDHIHIPASRLLSYQRGAYYSSAQLFNILPTSITTLKNDKMRFRLVLRKYLQDNSFYSITEFVDHAKGLKRIGT